MIDHQITAVFTAALSKWVAAAALHLDQERMELLGVCLKADDMDVGVVVRLREGAILLEATSERGSKRAELYRQDIEPFRPATPFAAPESKGGH